jgi:hypothetical protein
MDFGPAVRPAPDASAAAWIAPRQIASNGVGNLVPSGFERCLFVDDAPEDLEGDWWAAERAHTATIAAVAAGHTATPAHAYFAIWDGHGYPERGLEHIARFATPDPGREYYLLQGSVASVVEIVEPGPPAGLWRQPDLWWPEDRSWIVCTDVDLWCNYVAGSAALITVVGDAATTETHLVERTDPFERVY